MCRTDFDERFGCCQRRLELALPGIVAVTVPLAKNEVIQNLVPGERTFCGVLHCGGVSQVHEIDVNIVGTLSFWRRMPAKNGDVMASRCNGPNDGATSPRGATDDNEVFLQRWHLTHVRGEGARRSWGEDRF